MLPLIIFISFYWYCNFFHFSTFFLIDLNILICSLSILILCWFLLIIYFRIFNKHFCFNKYHFDFDSMEIKYKLGSFIVLFAFYFQMWKIYCFKHLEWLVYFHLFENYLKEYSFEVIIWKLYFCFNFYSLYLKLNCFYFDIYYSHQYYLFFCFKSYYF